MRILREFSPGIDEREKNAFVSLFSGSNNLAGSYSHSEPDVGLISVVSNVLTPARVAFLNGIKHRFDLLRLIYVGHGKFL